jgi:hypothetical protein
MRSFIAPSLVAASTLVVLAACSGNIQPSTPALDVRQPDARAANYRPMVSPNGAMSVLPRGFEPARTRPRWMREPNKRQRENLAVAEFGGSSVLWFKANDRKNNPPKVCEPADSTNGIRIDRFGNLWVPDGRADTTTEYAPHCGASVLTIPDATGEPADVAFDRRDHVYVMNINDVSGPPTIDVYTRTGKHLRTLGDPSFNVLFGVASDTRGNLFASALTGSNQGIVVEFPAGKMPGTRLTGVSLELPGVPALDSAENLVIADWGRLTIDVFAPPYTGLPSTSSLRGSSIWCPLDHPERRIYCGDADNGSIDVYAYPGGAYLYSYSAGLSPSALVTGVAPDPPAPY